MEVLVSSLVANESVTRLSVFFGMLLLMVALEMLLPKKTRTEPRLRRWLTNLSMVIIDSLAVRIVMPVVAVGVAIWAAENGLGLLNLVDMWWPIEAVIAFLLLDMLIYAQHVLFHKVPMLWALHKVHHVDRDIDATTGIRFHPVEILLSMLVKMFFVLVIGPAAAVVILFEIVLNAGAVFNHANLALPKRVDHLLRALIVTPDFHRVHHSIEQTETDSNYGFFLSFWDRLFGTYIAQPKQTHEAMTIGLAEHQTSQPSQLGWSLLLPWYRPSANVEKTVE